MPMIGGPDGGYDPTKTIGYKKKAKPKVNFLSGNDKGWSVKPTPKRRSSSGGGGGSSVGFSSSGSAGRSSAASAPPPPPPPPSIAEFLGDDSGYQSQLSALEKALGDYSAQMGKNKSRYDVGWKNNRRDLGIEQGFARDDQANDYASRGLYISGLQGKARGDLDNQYSRRFGGLDTDRGNYMDQLGEDLGNFKSEQGLTKANARSDAVARRALRYSI